jgi:hypothetical protein
MAISPSGRKLPAAEKALSVLEIHEKVSVERC